VSAKVCSARERRCATTIRGLVASCCILILVPGAFAADETQWRLVKIEGELMLAMTDTDDATDAIGSPYFRCKPGSGRLTVDSNMQDRDVRRVIASLILNDGYPTVELVPGPERSVIDQITSADDGGWGYRFQIDADAAAFKMFGKTGYFQFKIGPAVTKAGVKAGRDRIAEFQAACQRPAKPSVFDGPKPSVFDGQKAQE
jgi:hypothetical protein